MTDDFPTRVRTLLAENPRICGFGCNTREYDRETRTYVPKKRDGFYLTDAQIERLRKMVAFINENLPVSNGGGKSTIGSYGFKHVLERNHWTDDIDKYVSNGEGIVAMMLAGYKPKWSVDLSCPNCEFSVKAGQYRVLCGTAERPRQILVEKVSVGQA